MRVTPALLALIVTAAWTGGANGQQCEFDKPSDSVFDIVNDKGSKSGTAVLISQNEGLFLTALHLLGSSKLRLKRDGKEWPFTKILSGRNSTKIYDDWAIISTGTEPLLYEGIHLIYDMPSTESLRKSAVYNSAHSVGNVTSLKWNDTLLDGKVCSGDSVTVMRFSDYDRGDSGSPIFSPDECGVIGLSSRFMVSSEAGDAEQKEVYRLFEKFSENVRVEDKDKVDNASTLEGKISVVREILKEQIYIKIVPSKCILDAVVEETFFKKSQRGADTIRAAVRSDIGEILNFLPMVDPDDPASISRFAKMILKGSMRWPEIVDMWNRYHEGKIGKSLRTGYLSRSLRDALEDVSKQRKFSYLYTTYERGIRQMAAQVPAFDDFGEGGLSFLDFVEKNKAAGPRPITGLATPLTYFDFGKPSPSDSGIASIGAGLAMINELRELSGEERANDALVTFYQNQATQLLTSGISSLKNGFSIRSNLTGEAMISLAEIPKFTPSNVIKSNANLQSLPELSIALAISGKAQLDPSNADYIARYQNIVPPSIQQEYNLRIEHALKDFTIDWAKRNYSDAPYVADDQKVFPPRIKMEEYRAYENYYVKPEYRIDNGGPQ